MVKYVVSKLTVSIEMWQTVHVTAEAARKN